MTSLKQLEIFLQVVEKGSFTVAAETMYMTQPAISWQIKKLEEDLEVELFRKRDRNLELSEAGEIMHRGAKEMLSIYHNVKNVMEEYKSLGRGKLNIGASTIPGEYILPKPLSQFCNLHKGLEVKVEIDGSIAIIDRLAAGKLDIALVGAKKIASGVTYLPWLEDEIVGVTAFDNVEIPTKITLKELTKFTMLGRGVQSGTRIAIEKALQSQGMDILSFPSYVAINTTQGLLGAVAAGMGFAFLSKWAVLPMLQRKELRQLEIEQVEIKRKFYIAKWDSSYAIPTVEGFANFLLLQQNNFSQ